MSGTDVNLNKEIAISWTPPDWLISLPCLERAYTHATWYFFSRKYSFQDRGLSRPVLASGAYCDTFNQGMERDSRITIELLTTSAL